MLALFFKMGEFFISEMRMDKNGHHYISVSKKEAKKINAKQGTYCKIENLEGENGNKEPTDK